MKIIYPILLCFSFLFLSSCSKDYDTRLRGKWQMTFEVNSTGNHVVDSVYYNFDNHIFQVQYTTQAVADDDFTHIRFMDNFVGVFYQTGDSLELRIVDSVFIKKVLTYPSIGWKTASRKFRIKQISGSQLVLADDSVRYVFRKF